MCTVLRSLLLLALLSTLPTAVHGQDAADEEAAARRYARERFLREAVRSVGASGERAAPLGAMRQALRADISFLTSYEPADDAERALLDEFQKTVEERVLLIGDPQDTSEAAEAEEGSAGAIPEARFLMGWLTGETPCEVLVLDPGAADDKARAYRYPPLPPKAPPPPPAASEGPPAPPPEAGLDAPPPQPPPPPEGAAEAATPGPAPNGPRPEPMREGEVPAAPAPPPAEPPPEPPNPDEWAREVLRPAEGGVLLGKRIRPAVCTVVDRLLEVAAREPVFVHPEVASLRRRAIVSEDVFAYNLPFTALRLLQADERLKALQKDVPVPGLVDQITVTQKEKRAADLRKELEKWRAQRQRVEADLDQMALDIEDWNTQVALLSREIQTLRDASGGASAPEAEAPTPAPSEPREGEARPESLKLKLAEARESLVNLERRLFYLTAVRAQKRLELLDRLIKAAEQEATAAEQVYQRFADERDRIWNERRLDRLRSDERLLRRWIEASAARNPGEGSPGALRLAAYRAQLAVNEVAQEAVQQRRKLTSGGAPPTASPEPAPGRVPDAPPPPDETPSAEASDVARPRLSPILRSPHKGMWDLQYIELARAELRDPELEDAFDARLVAEHYTAVEDRIQALEASRALRREEERLQASFDEAKRTADAALEGVKQDYFVAEVRGLPKMLKEVTGEFESAMGGIRKQRADNEARLQSLKSYRKALKRQGVRSLLIRTDRDLNQGDLVQAVTEGTDALERAERWMTFQDEEHVGTFLQRSWPAVVALLAIAAALVFGARWGRKRVDAWIGREAARHPVLQARGASMRDEQEKERQRREAEQAAVPSEDHVLQQEEEDDREPPPGAAPPPAAAPPAAAPPAAPPQEREKGAERGPERETPR